MHIYVFGSLCRGEVSIESDIDLLALVDSYDERFDQAKYSIYSYTKIASLWANGSPFAWHLSLESRMLFASNGLDYLDSLGKPASYVNFVRDCRKFQEAFSAACLSVVQNRSSTVFDLSNVFLSVRNIATCFSLGVLEIPSFARNSALTLPDMYAIPISTRNYKILERARILCTRAIGEDINSEDVNDTIGVFPAISEWMNTLVERARQHERIQQSR